MKESDLSVRMGELIFDVALLAVFSLFIAPLIQESMPWVMWVLWVIATALTIGLAAYIGYLKGKGDL